MSKIDYTNPGIQALIREGLHSKKLKISFTKKDGTIRDMICTLNSEMIIPSKLPSDNRNVKISNDYIRVFDLEANDWRSFRFDSVISIENTEESAYILG